MPFEGGGENRELLAQAERAFQAGVTRMIKILRRVAEKAGPGYSIAAHEKKLREYLVDAYDEELLRKYPHIYHEAGRATWVALEKAIAGGGRRERNAMAAESTEEGESMIGRIARISDSLFAPEEEDDLHDARDAHGLAPVLIKAELSKARFLALFWGKEAERRSKQIARNTFVDVLRGNAEAMGHEIPDFLRGLDEMEEASQSEYERIDKERAERLYSQVSELLSGKYSSEQGNIEGEDDISGAEDRAVLTEKETKEILENPHGLQGILLLADSVLELEAANPPS